MKKYLIPAVAVSLMGCISISQLLNLSGLFALSAIPMPDFSNERSDDYGRVKIKLGAVDQLGGPLKSVLNQIELTSGMKTIEIESTEFISGHAQGNLLVLVDGSGSLESIGCASCPTDPMRHRVEAVIELASSLHECAPEWSIGLMEFGPRSSSGFNDSLMLVDYTMDTFEIESNADELISDGGTPLWDSLLETLDDLSIRIEHDLSDHASESEPLVDEHEERPSKNSGRGLVVVTDGEDTISLNTVEKVIVQAKSFEIPVSVIALGEASDLVFTSSETAVEDLRRLADETGGFYATVSMAMDLPILSDHVAKAYCGGHTEILARFLDVPDSGEQVDGRIWLKHTGLSAPFGFRAP